MSRSTGLATTATGTAPAGGRSQDAPTLIHRRIPAVLRWLAALAIGSSFFVVVEPAPTDLAFITLLVALFLIPGPRPVLNLNAVALLSLFIFLLVSTLSLLAPFYAFDRLIFYYSVTIYLVLTWYTIVVLLANYGAQMWLLLYRSFLIAATLAALIGFLVYFTGVSNIFGLFDTTYGDRVRSAFKDPNVYAPFLCAALLLVINEIIARRGLNILTLVLLCLFTIQILAAFSRGAFVNLAVSLVVYFSLILIIQRKKWLVRSILLSGIGLLLVVPTLVFFLQITGLEDFLLGRLRLQGYDTERFATHALALKTIGEAPFGIGPGQSEFAFPLSTHNLYLRVAVENGVLGAVSFACFLMVTLWFALYGALRRGPFQDIYICSLAILSGILVNSLVIDTLHWRHFFLFLAVPLGLRQHEVWLARRR